MNTKAIMDVRMSMEELSVPYYNTPEHHGKLYRYLEKQAASDGLLIFHKRYGDHDNYGYIQFNYLLKTIFNEMPEGSKYLEIGVYKGQALSLMLMLSVLYEKSIEVHGVSTFDGLGDKYSHYDSADFYKTTNDTCKLFSGKTPELYRGNSTDLNIVSRVRANAPYHCVFIDGGHDYNTVAIDIDNYSHMVTDGGYLIFDDACCDRDMNPEVGFKGHKEVTDAVNDRLSIRTDYKFLLAVGNVKVFQRIKCF